MIYYWNYNLLLVTFFKNFKVRFFIIKYVFNIFPRDIRKVCFYPDTFTKRQDARLRYLAVLQKSRRNLAYSRVRVVRIFTVSLNCLRVSFWAGNGRFARHEGPDSHRRRSWASQAKNEWSRFRTMYLSPIRSINANVPHLCDRVYCSDLSLWARWHASCIISSSSSWIYISWNTI